MREDFGLCTRVRHHQQKIVLFLAAMRLHAEELHREGYRVVYQKLGEGPPNYEEALVECLRASRANALLAYEPHDAFFRSALESAAAEAGAELIVEPSPGFLTSAEEWRDWAQRQRRYRMADFYAWQRRRLGILLEPDGEPVGGRWSFDTENRLPMPRDLTPPAVPWFAPDPTTEEVIALVAETFAHHPGDARAFAWPVTRAQALECLARFVEERLPLFGPYEDAISRNETTLWHSLLSPLLNLGLLTPTEVVERALARAGEVPLSSLEGFVRQVIGWREFIRGMDRVYAETGRHRANALGHERRLNECWWTARTGLPPLDRSIERCVRRGWCHHIERLMVIGAAMLMAEVHPEEAYRWFMEMFVDSADWVMAPNVMGMSQYADGGLMTTKPYFTGSAYLLKMSDWPRGPWCETWDGLYWRFVARHRDVLERNPRWRAVLGGLERLEPKRRDRIFAAAEEFVERTTSP